MSGKAKKLWRVCTTVLVALAVALAALLALVRLFGLTPYCVLSGSMEPAYPTPARCCTCERAPRPTCRWATRSRSC